MNDTDNDERDAAIPDETGAEELPEAEISETTEAPEDTDDGSRYEEPSEEPVQPEGFEAVTVTPVVEERRYRTAYRRSPFRFSYLLTGIIGAIIGGLIVAVIVPKYIYGKLIPYPQMPGSVLNQPIVIKTGEEVPVATAVANKFMPSVVRISTIDVQRDMFFGERAYEGVGSGAVVNSNGYILTNAHVVGQNPRKLTVFFQDGQELDGTVLWKDTVLDLAVVKVEASGLPAVELGDSDLIQVGETAIAIGNPLGLRFERTVTQGIISGLNRSIMLEEGDIMEDLIQTDAAINPGNSGGPLINRNGQVIGINTIKASAEGLGFAIPINICKPIIKQFVEKGRFTPSYMGVSLIDREMLGYYKTDIKIEKGIYIMSISPDTAAARAGLKRGDIILSVDGTDVNTMIKFKSVLYSKDPGDIVAVRYQRDGRENTVDVVLQTKPEGAR